MPKRNFHPGVALKLGFQHCSVARDPEEVWGSFHESTECPTLLGAGSLIPQESLGFLPDPCCWPRGCDSWWPGAVRTGEWGLALAGLGCGGLWSWGIGPRGHVAGGYNKTTGPCAASSASGRCQLSHLPGSFLPPLHPLNLPHFAGLKNHEGQALQGRVIQTHLRSP